MTNKEEREQLYLNVVDYIKQNKTSMRNACVINKVDYITFFNWAKEKGIKEELKEAREESELLRNKKAVKLILEKNYSLVQAATSVSITYTKLTDYIKTLDHKQRKEIKNKTRETYKLNMAKHRGRKTGTKNYVIEELIKQARKNKIHASKMLDVLIENNVNTPRLYFTNMLQKQGIQVID